VSRLDPHLTAAFFGSEAVTGREVELTDQPVPYTLTAEGEAAAVAEPTLPPGAEGTAAAIDEFYGRTPGTAARLYAELAGPDPEVTWEAVAEAADEWDCFDAAAYMDRVEAGLEPEAGL
jgi:hypothetical protein